MTSDDYFFIVVYDHNKYERFGPDEQEAAIYWTNEHEGSKFYLIRYFEHNGEFLPYSTKVKV